MDDIEAEVRDNYRYAHEYWQPFLRDAQTYTNACAGSTWTAKERAELQKEGREPIEFNITRRPISFFSGWLRDNLNSIIYSPVEGSDQKTADQFTKLSYHIWDKGNGYNTFLDSCDEALKSGMSLVGIQMDYSKDFITGDISFFKRTYNSFLLDPTFEYIDLRDCGFAITRDILSAHSVRSLLPDVSQTDINDLLGFWRDDKFMTFRPNLTSASRAKNLVMYDQYYRRTTRKRKFLVDLSNHYYKDISDLSSDEQQRLKMGLGRLDSMRSDSQALGLYSEDVPRLEIQTHDRPYIELHCLINGHRVFSGEDKTQICDTYPFAPAICFFEPSIFEPSIRVQGLGATQFSNQRQFNKRHMKIIDMFDSTISTGFKYFLGSVPDPLELQQTGANRIIGIDPDNAPQGLDSVQELAGGGANPALLQYQEILDNLSLTLGNVTQASIGMDEKINTLVSGRLAQVQIAQNLQSNRKIIDNVEETQIILGRLVMKAIQLNYPPEKIARILAEEPTQQFYEKQFEQYDAVVKEGVRSKTQKDAYYYELVNLKRDGIVDVPQSEIVRALGMAGLSDLEEAIKIQEQQQAEQQAKIDAQERMALELANAQKEQSIALAQERRARVVADLSLAQERASEAMENRAQAALARAKTITEISQMQEDRIMKVLGFIEHLEQQETADREGVFQEINSVADQINSETEGSSEFKRVTEASQEAQSLQTPQLEV